MSDTGLPEGTEVIEAGAMEVGPPYKSYGNPEKQYLCKALLKDEVGVTLLIFVASKKKWQEMKVPLNYPVRSITAEEKAEAETVKAGVSRPRKLKGEGDAPGEPRTNVGRSAGKLTGDGMLKCWGKYIHQFINVPGGRQKTVDAMLSEFPEKAESITRWVDAYKTYYNTGRLEKQGYLRQEVRLNWIMDPDDQIRIVEERSARAKAAAALRKEKKAAEPATEAATAVTDAVDAAPAESL